MSRIVFRILSAGLMLQLLMTPLAAQGFGGGGPASAPPVVKLDLSGNPAWERGAAVCGVGDVDGDTYPDIVVGDPGYMSEVGRVRCLSGQDGSVIWTVIGGAAFDRMGHALAPLEDPNGDGIKDVVVGIPGYDGFAANSGRVEVRSGVDGSYIESYDGSAVGEHAGWAVAGLANALPGVSRQFAYGSPYYDGVAGIDCGRLRIVDVLAGSLASIEGDDAGDRLGWALDNAGNFDGGVHDNLVVGIPFGGVGMNSGNGEVRVYRVAGIEMLLQVSGTDVASELGYSVAGIGDANGDGIADIAAGAPDYNSMDHTDVGRVRVIPGPAGFGGLSTTGSNEQERVGTSVAGIGDMDGDGMPDYAFGAIQNIGSEPGYARVRSGFNHAPYLYRDGSVMGGTYGSVVRGVGDIDGDGLADVAVGDATNGVLHIVGLALTYPGSNEDLVMSVSTSSFIRLRRWPDVRVTWAGRRLRLRMHSPNESYVGSVPVILAQPFATGMPPVSPMGFPEAHVSLGDYAVMFSGYWAPYFAPYVLTPDGVSLSFEIPPGFDGQSMMIQGACIAPSARQGNAFFTATAAYEIRLLAGPMSAEE